MEMSAFSLVSDRRDQPSHSRIASCRCTYRCVAEVRLCWLLPLSLPLPPSNRRSQPSHPRPAHSDLDRRPALAPARSSCLIRTMIYRHHAVLWRDSNNSSNSNDQRRHSPNPPVAVHRVARGGPLAAAVALTATRTSSPFFPRWTVRCTRRLSAPQSCRCAMRPRAISAARQPRRLRPPPRRRAPRAPNAIRPC